MTPRGTTHGPGRRRPLAALLASLLVVGACIAALDFCHASSSTPQLRGRSATIGVRAFVATGNGEAPAPRDSLIAGACALAGVGVTAAILRRIRGEGTLKLSGFALDLLVMTACVFCEVAVYMTGERASNTYTKESVLLCSSLSAVLASAGMAQASGGSSQLWQCFDPKVVIRLLPVSIGFTLSMLSLLMTLQHFDAAFVKLVGQLKLPLTAFMASVAFARRYSLMQWQIILMIVVSCCCFTVQRLHGESKDRGEVQGSPWIGFLYMPVWIIFNIVASLWAEHALKHSNLPFPVVIANMRIGEALTSVVLLWWAGVGPQHFFAGWDTSTLAVLLSLFLDALFSALVVKRLSTVAKNCCKCASLVLLYAIGLVSGRQPAVLSQGLAAILVVQATLLFATEGRTANGRA